MKNKLIHDDKNAKSNAKAEMHEAMMTQNNDLIRRLNLNKTKLAWLEAQNQRQSKALEEVYDHLYTLESVTMDVSAHLIRCNALIVIDHCSQYRLPAVAIIVRRQLDDARVCLADSFLLLFGNHFASKDITNEG